jgi:hypothetical protein
MKRVLPILMLLMLLTQACSGNTPAVTQTSNAEVQPTATSASAVEPIVHKTIPQAGTKSRSNAHDHEESTTFESKNVASGDDFRKNQYERPFTADMTYLPDIDIVDFSITSDDQFFYIKTTFAGVDLVSQSLTGFYGVELDRNSDGRGEILLMTKPPYSTDFTADNVFVYVDINGDVGGLRASLPDENASGNGYDGVIFDLSQNIQPQDPDLAWVHVIPGDKPAIEIAYKKWLFKDGNEQFMWNVWASKSEPNPGKFNLHDSFTAAQAGSPNKNDANFPLKDVVAVDNSCRVPLGFDVLGNELLGCLVKAQVNENAGDESGPPFDGQFPSVGGRFPGSVIPPRLAIFK